MNGIARRLFGPVLLFALCAGATAWLADEQTRSGLEAGLNIGMGPFSAVLGIASVLTGAWLADRLIRLLVWEFGVARATAQPVPRLLVQISTLIVYVIALMTIVGFVFNQPLTGIFAASGLIGVVIGFALRNIILDAFSGIAMNMDQPFRIGEWVSVQGRNLTVTGRIEEMLWRTTRLITREDNVVIVPNSEMGMATIVNLSRPIPYSQQIMTIVLDHDLPVPRALALIRAALLAAVRDHRAIAADPAPLARIESADGNGVTYQIVYHLNFALASPFSAKHIVMRRVLEHLYQAGARPAVKRQDLFTAAMPDRRIDSKRPDHRRLLLSRVDLFAGLTEDELGALADAMAVRRFDEADRVIRAGDPGQSMFVASEGFLRVVDGEEREIGTIMPGEFFGEMSLLTGEPRSATVHAATDAVCFEIDKDNLLPLLQSRPDIAERISRKIARRQMRNEAAATANEAEREVRTQTFAREVLARMRRFFGAQ